MLRELRQWVDEYTAGKAWWPRVPVWLGCGYLFVQYVRNPAWASVFGGLNLGIHEFGHWFFGPFGLTANVAGGTIVQLAVPLFSFRVFARQRDPFAIAFSFAWLGDNLMNVAIYVADANARSLQLVSPFGGDVYHDWTYLLGHAGLLKQDQAIAWGIRTAGYACLAASVMWGAWVLWAMVRPRAVPLDLSQAPAAPVDARRQTERQYEDVIFYRDDLLDCLGQMEAM